MHCATHRANFAGVEAEDKYTAREVQLAGQRGALPVPYRRFAWTLLLLYGCSSGVPLPPRTRHARESYLPVPYPPPAGLAETVPKRPSRDGAVWIDGEWAFHGRTYVWQRGGWVFPPEGARFAPWRALYQNNGRLMLAPGTWYDENGKSLPPPEVLTPARTPPNEITAESQSGR